MFQPNFNFDVKISRREFLKYMCATGAILIARFLVPFGKAFATKIDTTPINHEMEQPTLVLPQRDPSYNVAVINSALENSEKVKLGEGVFDITPSWQNEIPGVHEILGIQIPKSNTTLEGSGIGKTVLRASRPDMIIISNFHRSAAPDIIWGVRVANLTLDGNKLNNTPVLDSLLIGFRKSVNVVYDRIEAINGAFIGIQAAGVSVFPEDGDGKNFTISNCIARNCNDNGIDIATANATITNCIAINNNAAGGGTSNLDFDGADSCLVDGFRSIGGTIGICISSTERPSNNIIIKNVSIQNPRQYAIACVGAKGSMILNSQIETENDYSPIEIRNGASVSKISNVQVITSSGSSIIEKNNLTTAMENPASVFGYYFGHSPNNKPPQIDLGS